MLNWFYKLYEDYPLLSLIIIVLVFMYLDKYISNLMNERQRSFYSTFKSYILAISIPVVAFYFWFSAPGNPIDEYRLIRGPLVYTRGYVYEFDKEIEYDESDEGQDMKFVSYCYSYWFELPDGKKVQDGIRSDSPLVGFEESSFIDTENPQVVWVEYLSIDHSLNRIRGSGNQTFWDLFVNRILIGLFFFGVYIYIVYKSFRS